MTSTENAIAVRDETQLMTALRTSLYPGASDESIAMVRAYCAAAGFDVMLKPVHIVPMWDSASERMRDVVMPGIGLYRTVAARTGCMGIGEPEFGPDETKTIGNASITFPTWCKVTVKRMVGGKIAEFTARELWIENYASKKRTDPTPNAMWTKRPYGQLAKCAEAQALRKAFPEVGAQPTAEEMEGKSIDDPNAIAGEYTVVEKPAVTQPREKAPPAAEAQPQVPETATSGPHNPASAASAAPGIHGLSESQRRILGVCIKSARTTEGKLLERYPRVDLSNLNDVLKDLRALAEVE